MNWLKNNWFKILAALLLFGALMDNPYSYYQILRWVVTGAAGFSAYLAHKEKKDVWITTLVAIAIIFNPFIPFYFSRETWQIIDTLAGIVFVISVFAPLNWRKSSKINEELNIIK